MINGNTGFCALNSGLRYVRRTTNGGFNWIDVDQVTRHFMIYILQTV
ncbi:MAG: hypothetical protein IPG99_21445 [Ignavibacteria bacterium]|nr:hypothetical protein [Ignavibacteria bacterium]